MTDASGPDALPLIAEACVPLADPAGMLAQLCAHFESHGTVTRCDSHATIVGTHGLVTLTVDAGILHCHLASQGETALSIAKMVVADHLFQFAGAEHPVFTWSGHVSTRTTLPYFHELTVRDAFDITPLMRRVVLAGDVRPLATGGLHVRVLIPPAGRTPCWPVAREDGRILWPQGEDALTPRVYTLRQIDFHTGEAAIDVALHEGPATPGAAWARSVTPGTRVGLLGPGGGALPEADWYAFAGDETALPAIARMLEAMPAGIRVVARIEVANAGEEQPIRTAADLDLRWLHRDGVPARISTALQDAVRAIPWPQDATAPYAWVGCEQSAARALRAHLAARGLAKHRRSVAAYWRRGYQGVDIGD